ncbi:MAG: hypothetical protein A2077_02990 [Nitrospirae bacterium GWC2_46_6]|nr:MAG: hypothetical protein A2077_02990 [Nitrospirae bacterium GWC2_46_6]OGW25292.1 MAG: hypothetical protein A2X55_11430 [Nitrospirae bacterium GWB2_47_37]HAK87963.1 hypothetical protein [Nitrospiraceae bacterium]HCZ12869.1 hypothetical protein [Nitrospiraceae bacterium]
MTVKFPDLLACPQCRTTMSYKGGNKEGVLSCIGCSLTFPVINAIPRIINEDEKEKQTVESFGHQWSKVPSWNISDKNSKLVDAWVWRWFGWKDFSGLKDAIKNYRVILDVGSGLGHELDNFASANPEAAVFGLEPSKTVDISVNVRDKHNNVLLVQADIMKPPFGQGTFDMIFAKGILHHTTDTKTAFRNCVELLRSGGEIAVYIYNKKAPIREFTDDLLRGFLTKMNSDEAWESCKGITELGQKLSGINIEIELERGIPLLGIKPGKHNLQRLMYYTMFKMFYNSEFDFEENNLVNFDWYHPEFAWRHTPEEIKSWCNEFGLDIIWFNEEPSGIAVRAIKKEQL